jgi:hypothetical protein
MAITTMGLGIAKNVFQIHGVDANGKVVLRKQLKRSQVLVFFANLLPCLIGLEASPGFACTPERISQIPAYTEQDDVFFEAVAFEVDQGVWWENSVLVAYPNSNALR